MQLRVSTRVSRWKHLRSSRQSSCGCRRISRRTRNRTLERGRSLSIHVRSVRREVGEVHRGCGGLGRILRALRGSGIDMLSLRHLRLMHRMGCRRVSCGIRAHRRRSCQRSLLLNVVLEVSRWLQLRLRLWRLRLLELRHLLRLMLVALVMQLLLVLLLLLRLILLQLLRRLLHPRLRLLGRLLHQ